MARPKAIKEAATVDLTANLERILSRIKDLGLRNPDGTPITEYDPLERLIRIAADPMTDAKLAADLNKEIAQYFYPKKKAIEVAGPGGGPVIIKGMLTKFDV